MKDLLKVIFTMIIGLTIAIVIYPFIHELGHFIACKLVGAEVSKFSVLPAFVECNILNLSKHDIISIGVSGNLLPTIICIIMTLIVKPKNIYVWYIKTHFTFTCWLSWVLSLVNIIAVKLGYEDTNIVNTEDIASLVIRYADISTWCFSLCIVMIVISQTCIINKTAINQFKDCFNKLLAEGN